MPGTAWVSVDGEVVAVDLGGRAHVLTSTGALLWPLLDGRTTSVELAADVADVFGVEPAVADDDVRRFVEEMTGRGLIRPPGTAETERTVDVVGAGQTSRELSGRRNSWSSPPPMAPPDPDWIGAVAVEVGDQRIALRADASDVMDQLVQIFRPWIVEGDVPADGFGISIDRRGGAGPRLTPQLLYGRSNVLSSRSQGRLLRCLDVALGSLAHEGDGLRIHDMAALVQRDAAALVPATVVERSTALERAVAAGGCVDRGATRAAPRSRADGSGCDPGSGRPRDGARADGRSRHAAWSIRPPLDLVVGHTGRGERASTHRSRSPGRARRLGGAGRSSGRARSPRGRERAVPRRTDLAVGHRRLSRPRWPA